MQAGDADANHNPLASKPLALRLLKAGRLSNMIYLQIHSKGIYSVSISKHDVCSPCSLAYKRESKVRGGCMLNHPLLSLL